MNSGDPVQDTIFVVVLVGGAVLFLAFGLLPTLTAFWRKHPSRYSIAIINFTLGWTGIAWVGALVWALSQIETHKQPNKTNNKDFKLALSVDHTKQSSSTSDLTAENIVSKIERLSQLKNQGAISDIEYDHQKSILLDKL